MKTYLVRYTYNHGWIETEMKVKAENAEEAKAKAFEYAGVERVISAKEIEPDIYAEFGKRYKEASPERRKESREHWTSCHKQNVKAGRYDLIIFSAQILAAYDVIDSEG